MECTKFLMSSWKSKKLYVLLRLLSLFLCISVFLNCSLGINAESVTPTPSTYDGTWDMNTYDFLELFWDSAVREIASSYVVGSSAIFGEFQHFIEWLEGDPNYGVLEQYPNTTIHSTKPPTGNAYRDIDNSDEIDIPVPVQNVILQYVQYQVAENPVGYKECYIYSYNFLDPNSVSTYNMYVSLKQYIKQQKGKWVMVAPRFTDSSGAATSVILYTIDLSNQDVGLVE